MISMKTPRGFASSNDHVQVLLSKFAKMRLGAVDANLISRYFEWAIAAKIMLIDDYTGL